MRISDWSSDVCSSDLWSPNRMVDVVTEPGCMMALGADLLPTGGKLQGSQSSISDGTNTRKMFAQMHYYISPVWAMLDMFTDLQIGRASCRGRVCKFVYISVVAV